MFRDRNAMRRRLHELIERFRQKGATSPEKAMTIQELGLPPRFEEAMRRRLGQSGIFVEVNGKYYLSEERLKQIQEQRQKARGTGAGEGWNARRTMWTLRVARMVTTFLFVVLLLVNLFIQSWEIRLVASALLVVWIVLFLVYIYYLSRVRRRFYSAQSPSACLTCLAFVRLGVRSEVFHNMRCTCANKANQKRQLNSQPLISWVIYVVEGHFGFEVRKVI